MKRFSKRSLNWSRDLFSDRFAQSYSHFFFKSSAINILKTHGNYGQMHSERIVLIAVWAIIFYGPLLQTRSRQMQTAATHSSITSAGTGRLSRMKCARTSMTSSSAAPVVSVAGSTWSTLHVMLNPALNVCAIWERVWNEAGQCTSNRKNRIFSKRSVGKTHNIGFGCQIILSTARFLRPTSMSYLRLRRQQRCLNNRATHEICSSLHLG